MRKVAVILTITATATDGTKVSASVEINVVENKPRYLALVVANGDYAGVLNDLPGAGNNVKTVSGFHDLFIPFSMAAISSFPMISLSWASV